MERPYEISINAIDNAIKSLIKQKELLLESLPLIDRVKPNYWVINKQTNKYYQFKSISGIGTITLERHKETVDFTPTTFNKSFRLANKREVTKHEGYLNNKINLSDKTEIGSIVVGKQKIQNYKIDTINKNHGLVVLRNELGFCHTIDMNFFNEHFMLPSEEEALVM